MENSNKVKVISAVSGRVGVTVPQLRFSREWMAQGQVIQIEREVLDELMYDQGFKYMIETGILYIEDMEVKKELGVEPEDATEPENIIVLTDKERDQYMRLLTIKNFKEKVDKLSFEQINELADYAIRNKIMDLEKSKYIKSKCGKDIIRAIQLKEQDEEETEKKEG